MQSQHQCRRHRHHHLGVRGMWRPIASMCSQNACRLHKSARIAYCPGQTPQSAVSVMCACGYGPRKPPLCRRKTHPSYLEIWRSVTVCYSLGTRHQVVVECSSIVSGLTITICGCNKKHKGFCTKTCRSIIVLHVHHLKLHALSISLHQLRP